MARGFKPKVFLAGRVAVETDGVVIEEDRFPGRQGRLLFAYLVAEQGRPVPRDELAEALWGEAPPATWDKALTVIVSKLRRLLADRGIDDANVLTGAFGCYRLDLPEGTWVDVIVAANAAQEAEEALTAGELEKAKAAAALAASLVRQPFLPAEEGAWVEEKRRELADVRGRALSALADACLRSGDAPEAVKWAEQTIALAPFRETGYRRLMEAHVAAGNPAEALRVYERCRLLLAEELGTYPSPETESVYRALLGAAAPHAGAAATPEPPPPPEAAPPADLEREPGSAFKRRLVSRRGVMAATAIGALAAAAAVAGVLATWDGGSHVALVAANSVGVVDSHSGRFVADVGVGATPTRIAVGEGAIWVTSADDHSVSRIDPVTKARVQTITIGNSPSGIAVGNGAVWVANGLDGTVSRIDPATNSVVQMIDVGNGPVGIVYARGSIWVADTGDGTITRIDADSGKPTKTLQIAATELAYGAGSLWASQRGANQVARIDPSTGDMIKAITVGNGPTGMAVGDGAVWVANSLDGTVTRINSETNTIAATVPTVGNGPTGVAVDPHGVWVTNQFDGTLARIDPRTSQVARRFSVGNRPQGVATSDGDVLVAVRDTGANRRGGTLTLRSDLLPHTNPTRHPLLERQTRRGVRLPRHFRARLQGRRAGDLLRRDRRRGPLQEESEALRSLARDRRERRRGDRRLPPRRARPGLPVQARGSLRLRAARAHPAAGNGDASTARNRAVRDRELPAQAPAQARSQQVLSRVVAGGTAGRLPRPDSPPPSGHRRPGDQRRDPGQGRRGVDVRTVLPRSDGEARDAACEPGARKSESSDAGSLPQHPRPALRPAQRA
jgi:YVTN family beta-propeller protein